MTKQIPWLRVFVEGVVIVVSILLAFGLQAWWDGVQEREEEQQYLRALQADFHETQDLFLTEIAFYEVIDEHNRTFLRLLDSPVGSVPVDSLELMVRKAFISGEFIPVLATYNDMVNSGASAYCRGSQADRRIDQGLTPPPLIAYPHPAPQADVASTQARLQLSHPAIAPPDHRSSPSRTGKTPRLTIHCVYPDMAPTPGPKKAKKKDLPAVECESHVFCR